jgi:hypothetical protein
MPELIQADNYIGTYVVSTNDYVDMPELIQFDMPELIQVDMPELIQAADNYIGTHYIGTPVLQTATISFDDSTNDYVDMPELMPPGHTCEEIDARFSIIFLLQSLSSMQEMD